MQDLSEVSFLEAADTPGCTNHAPRHLCSLLNKSCCFFLSKAEIRRGPRETFFRLFCPLDRLVGAHCCAIFLCYLDCELLMITAEIQKDKKERNHLVAKLSHPKAKC